MTADGDIRIRILNKDSDFVYRVEAQTGDGSFFADQMQLGDAEKTNLLTLEGDNQKYGARLAQLLFSPKILDAYQQTLGRARAAGSGRVRIRLWISSDCAELHEFAWERLFLEWDGNSVAVACASALPFSRYTGLARPEPQAKRERGEKLRLLVAISNPTGLPPGFEKVPVRDEIAALFDVLKPLDGIQVTLLPGRTSAAADDFPDFDAQAKQWRDAGFTVLAGATTPGTLEKSLAHQDIVHFIGHGAYSRKTGGSVLFLEGDDGSVVAAQEADIVSLIMHLDPLPRLLFLASCDTAKHPDGDARAFVSVGPRLVEAGFPAVVAMQQKVPMELAQRLTLEFYRNLLDHGTIDLALNQSRGLLFTNSSADWSIPVLFMRVADGRLFEPDPVRAALHAMAEGPGFSPGLLVSDLPLEAVVLSGQQLTVKSDGDILPNRVPPTWERAVSSALYRVDLLKQIHSIADALSDAPAYNLTVIIGERGAAKAAFLRRLARETSINSLAGTRNHILPIYVDLDDYAQSRPVLLDRLHALLAASLQPYWPEKLDENALEDLLNEDKIILRIVFNNGDDLPALTRDQILQEVRELAENHPRHQYFFGMERGCWNLSELPVTALVAVQPLARHRIEVFLRSQSRALQPAMTHLAKKLADANLYDVAAMPWLLLRMGNQARQGMLPVSRAQVLQSIVDDGVEQIPVDRGQQSRARESLYALALRMHRTYRNGLQAPEAFETLAKVRGYREYNLEELLTCLLGQNLLEQTTDGTVRFSFPFIQSFCCARALVSPEELLTLEQVTSGLGRPKYLKWWEECLILLSGLIKEPAPLLRHITFGSTLTEGEHLFLAARCLQESGMAKDNSPISEQIVDALMWRSDAANESRIGRRVLAIRSLSGFARPEVLRHLTSVARDKVRKAWDGQTTFEYGAVRQAAARGLFRLPQLWDDLRAADSPLVDVMQQWRDEDVKSLGGILCSPPSDPATNEKACLAGIAAFALGDLQYDEAAREALYSQFVSPATDTDTRWSVADALLSLDPDEVIDRVVRPSFKTDAKPPIKVSEWNSLLLYLVGQLRPPDPAALDFVERILKDPAATASWKGRALLALGMLNAQSWRDDLVRVALGDFSSIQARSDDPEKDYLRQKALEALEEIGTMKELAALRSERGKAEWPPYLLRVSYNTSEAISSRQYDICTQ